MSEVVHIPPEVPPGTIIAGRFHIERLLGRGGMGAVYQAYDTAMARQVATKVIAENRRLSQEISVLAALQHPNIVCIHAVERDAALNASIMVLELVSGRTLFDIVEAEGPLGTAACVHIAKQALAALAHAHSKRIVHRDLKPQNMMLDETEHLKILDFGLAKVLGVGDQRLTQAGQVVGTAYYMSPEQCAGQEVTLATDIYALGATLFFVATGKAPFDGETPLEVCLKQTHEAPPIALIPDARFAKIVGKAMAKNPDDRFHSAAEMLEAINRDTVSIALPAGPRPAAKQRVNARTTLLVVSLISTICIAFFSMVNHAVPPEPMTELNHTEAMRTVHQAHSMAESKTISVAQYESLNTIQTNADALKLGPNERVSLAWTLTAMAQQLKRPDEEIMHRRRLIALRNQFPDLHYWESVSQLESLLATGRTVQAVRFAESQLEVAQKAKVTFRQTLKLADQWMLYHALKAAGEADRCLELDKAISGSAAQLQQDAELLGVIKERLAHYPADPIGYLAKYYLELPHSHATPDLRATAQALWDDREQYGP